MYILLMIYISNYNILLYNFLYFHRYTGSNTELYIFINISFTISFHNVLHLPTLTLTYLKYINILYVTLFKILFTQQAHTDLSILHYLKCVTKSIKNFVLTSLVLYITLINITLIILNNCLLLNPEPVNPNALSVFYLNIQRMITFNS